MLYLSLVIVLLMLVYLFFNPLILMNALAFSRKVKRYKNLSYANDTRHKLDLYAPKLKGPSSAANQVVNNSVIVFVYGGAWDSGHKDNYKFAAVELAKLGYITAVPNYRLYPDVKFPHFIEDVASACAALPQQLVSLGLKPQVSLQHPLSIILIGHSAGAHTVAMLNTEPKYLKQAEANIKIQACIGLAGPYDLPLDDPLVTGKFDGVQLHDISEQQHDMGHVHNHHDANPINLATDKMSKMLLMHGRADETVGLYHLERFSQRLTELKVEHQTIIYDKVPHRHIVGGLSKLFQFMNPVYKDIAAYLRRL